MKSLFAISPIVLLGCMQGTAVQLPDLAAAKSAILMIREGDAIQTLAFDPAGPKPTLSFTSLGNAELFLLSYESSLTTLSLSPGTLQTSEQCSDCRALPQPEALYLADAQAGLGEWRFVPWSPAEIPEVYLPRAPCVILDRLDINYLNYPHSPEAAVNQHVLSGAYAGQGRALVASPENALHLIGKTLDTLETVEVEGPVPRGASTNDGEKIYFMDGDGLLRRWTPDSWDILSPLAALDEHLTIEQTLVALNDELFVVVASGTRSPDGPAPPFKGAFWHYTETSSPSWTMLDQLACIGATCMEPKSGRIATIERSRDTDGQDVVWALYPSTDTLWRYSSDAGLVKMRVTNLTSDEYPTAIRWLDDIGLIVGTSEGRLLRPQGSEWVSMNAPTPRFGGRPIREIEPLADGFVFTDTFDSGRLVYHSEATSFCTPEPQFIRSEAQQIVSGPGEIWVLERNTGPRDARSVFITHVSVTD